jgi:hypothetical protein
VTTVPHPKSPASNSIPANFEEPFYWIVNPDLPHPELTVFELRDGRYALAAKTSAPFAAEHPFTVSIDPACLTDGLRR